MCAENHRPGGVPDRGTLQTSMREAAQRAQELQRQAEAARASLNAAAAKVQELEQQAATAQKTITLFQEQEGAIAHALQAAQQATDELMRTAKARADETIAAAKSAAEGIVHTARTTAAETVQKARESSQEQIRAAERATAAAKTAADEIVQAARAAADETLRKARASAQEQIHAAERTATEHLTRLRAESDELVEESNRKVQEVRHAAEQYLTGITARLDAFIRDREHMSRGLEALAKNHAESLQLMTRLRGEVQSQILPAVHRLMRRLKGEDAGEPEDTTPLPVSTSAEEPAEVEAAAASEEPVAAAAEASPAAAEEPTEPSVPRVRYTGEIVVSPIHSFLQATKFMTALSQIRGVASVKLRTYSGAKATIEIVTEGHTLAGINCEAIDGFAVEVVESTDAHLILRIGSPAPRPVHG